ncbi:rod-binding protein [Roseomonas sp. CCTCC AB2023176]|uniref:rod-binding protein n=1 Tax=Roseomonas sp. CCTCC AB2023176 TaxID=3342640 RepID=UPI0035E30FC5
MSGVAMRAAAGPGVAGSGVTGVMQAPAGGSLARMRDAAQRFEAQMLGALLQPVFGEAPKGLVSGGTAEAQWRPMLIENYARGWAARGGIGIASAVLSEMMRTQARAGVAEAGGAWPHGLGAGDRTGGGNAATAQEVRT